MKSKETTYCMLRITNLFLLLVFSTPAFSQESQDANPHNEKAINILHDARDKLKAHNALKLEFTFSAAEATLGPDDNMDGFMYLQEDKFYIKSGPNYFISDGTNAWTFLESVNEVHISRLEDTETVMTPTSLLENFTESFNPLWIREESGHEGKVHVIDMVYIEPATFQKYRIAVEENSGFLKYISAVDGQGNSYTYDIKSTEVNPEIPDKLFTFEPERHPDIEIIDLR
jgi:outer membrane lipoprotein-sorting protein